MKQSEPVRLRLLYVGGVTVLLALVALLVGAIFHLDEVTRTAWSFTGSGCVVLLISGIGFAIYGKVDRSSKDGRGSSR